MYKTHFEIMIRKSLHGLVIVLLFLQGCDSKSSGAGETATSVTDTSSNAISSLSSPSSVASTSAASASTASSTLASSSSLSSSAQSSTAGVSSSATEAASSSQVVVPNTSSFASLPASSAPAQSSQGVQSSINVLSSSSDAVSSSSEAASSSDALSSSSEAASSSDAVSSSSEAASSSDALSSSSEAASSSDALSSSSEAASSSDTGSSSSEATVQVPVTDGLIVRLNASDLALSNGSVVSTWESLSPATVNATQASAGKSPTFIQNAINGQSAVRFDGVDDALILDTNVFNSTATPLTTLVAVQSDDYRAFIVGNGVTSGSNMMAAGYGLGFAAGKVFAKSRDGFNGGVWMLGSSELQLSGANVFGARFSANESQLISRCFSENITATPAPADSGQSVIGGSTEGEDAFAGDISEILIYDRVLTEQEFADVRNYLATKYNAPIAALVDSDSDGLLDACDENQTYLYSPTISVTLESPMALVDNIDPTYMIDLDSPRDRDPHRASAHIYNDNGAIVARFDLNNSYDLSQIHFWNFDQSLYDVDTVTIDYYDESDQLITQTVFEPQLGFDLILAEDITIDVDGVNYLRVTFEGSNNETEFMNIGFTGTASP